MIFGEFSMKMGSTMKFEDVVKHFSNTKHNTVVFFGRNYNLSVPRMAYLFV